MTRRRLGVAGSEISLKIGFDWLASHLLLCCSLSPEINAPARPPLSHAHACAQPSKPDSSNPSPKPPPKQSSRQTPPSDAIVLRPLAKSFLPFLACALQVLPLLVRTSPGSSNVGYGAIDELPLSSVQNQAAAARARSATTGELPPSGHTRLASRHVQPHISRSRNLCDNLRGFCGGVRAAIAGIQLNSRKSCS